MAKPRTQLPKSPTGVKVVDLLENPQPVRGDQILATPTLEQKLPLPIRRIIGDLSNTKRVMVGLDLRNKA